MLAVRGDVDFFVVVALLVRFAGARLAVPVVLLVVFLVVPVLRLDVLRVVLVDIASYYMWGGQPLPAPRGG
jgi:hypothetical protein